MSKDRITIEAAQNGYVVRDEIPYGNRDMMASSAPFVFETFESLTMWLTQNLTQPDKPKAEGTTK